MGILNLAADAVTPWYIKWPLRVLGGVKAFFAWVFASPLRIAIVVAAISISGNVWLWHSREAEKADLAKTKTAWAADIAQAKAQAAAKSVQLKDNANAGQKTYQDGLAQSNGLLAAYVRDHPIGVRQSAPDAIATSGDHTSPIFTVSTPAAAVATSGATITIEGLNACDADYVYAKSAFEWAQGLNKAPEK